MIRANKVDNTDFVNAEITGTTMEIVKEYETISESIYKGVLKQSVKEVCNPAEVLVGIVLDAIGISHEEKREVLKRMLANDLVPTINDGGVPEL